MKVLRGYCYFCKEKVMADETQLITYATINTPEGEEGHPTHKLCRKNYQKKK